MREGRHSAVRGGQSAGVLLPGTPFCTNQAHLLSCVQMKQCPEIKWIGWLLSVTACSSIAASVPAARDADALAAGIVSATGLRGGLAVHVDCADGALGVALARTTAFRVHGVAGSEKDVRAAASAAREAGLAGRVTVGRLRGKRLPYVDRLVRLLVCDADTDVPRAELMRVLAPGGAVCYLDGERIEPVRKPRSASMGEWTHYLHGADNNAVVDDKAIGPPRHVQWIAEPHWGRNHESLASVSAVVTARGRLFAIVDEGPAGVMHLPPQWRLVARDAFSGIVLWRRKISSWEDYLRPFRSGPPQLPRRLVAAGDRVYVTLGSDRPVEALDAETGETRMTFEQTAGAEEILVADGRLVAVIGQPGVAPGAKKPPRHLVVVDADTGKTLWQRDDDAAAGMLPLSATVADARLFFATCDAVYAMDAKTGAVQWEQPNATPTHRGRYWSATVVAHRGVLLVGGEGRLAAFACEDGKPLWDARLSRGFNSAGDVFGIGDAVWAWSVPELTKAQKKDVEKKARKPWKWAWGYVSDHYGCYESRDLKTGVLRRTLPAKGNWTFGHHHRCFRNKATTRFLLTGKRGIEFFDVSGKRKSSRHRWVRGMCQYGIMPANGMLYVPGHPCRCYQQEKINGFLALLSHRKGHPPAKPLEKGPAYGEAGKLAKSAAIRDGADWPMYRHDPARSGSSGARVPGRIQVTWRSKVGAGLTAPVVVGKRLYIAEADAGIVHALDARDGTRLWSHGAEGAVDSPPTVHGGLLLFGTGHGWVTCLRAEDGALCWRRRIVPVDRLIVSCGRLESAWPVHGSVLVHGTGPDEAGIVYASAGRAQHLDGGIRVPALDVASGEFVPSHDKKHQRRTPALNDILVSDGVGLFLRGQRVLKFGAEGKNRRGWALAADAGLLDGSLFDRTIWKYRSVHGQMLVFDRKRIYGVRGGYHIGHEFLRVNTSVGKVMIPNFAKYRKHGMPRGNLLFCAAPDAKAGTGPAAPPWTFRSAPGDRVRCYHWMQDVPLQIRAMVLARRADAPGKRLLFVAGWTDPEPGDNGDPGAGSGSMLWVFDPEKGARLSDLKLDARPVFDGMAAAGEGLYIALEDGSVVRFGE